jgi:hypothetical protein
MFKNSVLRALAAETSETSQFKVTYAAEVLDQPENKDETAGERLSAGTSR